MFFLSDDLDDFEKQIRELSATDGSFRLNGSYVVL